MSIVEEIFELRDIAFKEFNAKLIPNVDKESVIGVKTPALKAMAKRLIKEGREGEILNALPHKYFEENQLHSFIISEIKDFDRAIFEIERFLPFVDNWATCDQLIPKAIAKNPERAEDIAKMWLNSSHTYTIRFGIGIYMRYFLDDRFKPEYLDLIASVKSEQYYVNMMIAWYFATALAKHYDATLPIFCKKRLSKWVHNKAISKARESFRVSDEHKAELNGLKIKK